MNRFLQECQKIYHNLIKDPTHYRKVRVVMGNESCDLDSAVASIIYSYIIYHENKQKGVRNYEVLPLLNIAHEDIPLKTEVTFYLQLHGISLDWIPTRGIRDELTCRDTFSLLKLHKAGVLELTLVDHHVLSPSDEALIPSVVEIIDHRPRNLDWDWPNVDITVKTVGSCCTLIAKKILERSPHLLTFQICHLLYAPIVLDTVNLSPEAGRTTDLDKQVIRSLERKISVDRNRLFQDLIFAKTQVAGLTDLQILRKDVKVMEEVTVAGLPMLVRDFVKRNNVEHTMFTFLRSRNDLPLMILMGLKINGDSIERDLGVFSTSHIAAGKLGDALTQYNSPSLGLSEVTNHTIKFLKVYRQKNSGVSRKQIGPILQTIMPDLMECIKCYIGK